MDRNHAMLKNDCTRMQTRVSASDEVSRMSKWTAFDVVTVIKMDETTHI